MMNRLRNEQGVALVTALMLTLLSLAVVAAVLYLVTQGIQISAASKRYKTAREASQGGMEVFTKDILTQLYTGSPFSTVKTSFSSIGLSFGTYSTCTKQKLTTATAQWTCNTNANNPSVNYDAIFTLKGTTTAENYNVYAQIVDTVPGNSDTSGVSNLDGGGGVATGAGAGGISPMHIPALYTIEIQGQKQANPLEKAKLSVLYTY
jgi:Tfp pilus assembly protein PilX